MYIYQTVSVYDFRRAFELADRTENFSYAGLEILFDWLESYAEDSGEPIELDVIALCCEWNEYDLETINQEYYQEFETLEEAESWLQDETLVAGSTDDTIIFQCF